MNLQEIRQKYPQYDDVSDEQLARSLHSKYYSDMDFGEFSTEIGLQSSGETVTPPQPTPQGGVPVPENTQSPEPTNIYENPVEFVKGAFKVGSTEGLAFLSSAARAGLVDPFIAYGIEGNDPAGTFVSRFTEAYENNKNTLLQMQQDIGLTPVDEAKLLAADPSGGVLLSGVKAVADPFSYLGAPVSIAGVGTRAGGSFLAGGTAEVGADVGAQLEQSFTGEQTGVGALVGGIATGVAATPTATAAQYGVTKASNTASRLYTKIKQARQDGGIPKEELDSIAAKGTENFLRQVTEGEGLESIDELVTSFDKISSLIDSKSVPLFVSMASNPTVRDRTLALADRKPAVRKKLQDEVDRIVEEIGNKADTIFGARFSEVASPKVSDDVRAAAERADSTLAQAERKINELSFKFSKAPSEERVGRAITNLVEAKKKAARKAVEPQYTELFNSARQQDVSMKGRGAREIYEFVRQNNLRDLFGKGTAIDKDIQKFFAPTVKGRGIKVYADVPFDTVDSLKKEINRLQRGKLTETEARKLEQLEGVVNSARENYIPKEFNEALKAIDANYYKKVGMPFTEQGVLDINSKKYAEQVAPVITSKPSAMRQFLQAVPDKRGVTIARNAFLSRMAKQVMNPDTGIIDQKKLNRYIQQFGDVIDEVPVLRKEIDAIQRTNGDLLYLQQNALDTRDTIQKDIANNELLNIDREIPNYNAMARKMFSGVDRAYLRNTLKKVDQLSVETKEAVLDNIRREVIEVARENTDGAFAFVTDPTNQATLARLMGPEYVSQVKDMSRMLSSLKEADLRQVTNFDNSVQDGMERATGIPFPQIVSRLRNQIRSKVQSGVELFTKGAAFKTQQAEDAAVLQELMKPANVAKFSKFSDKVKGKNLTAEEAKEVYSILKNVAPAYFIIGGSTGAAVNRQNQQEQ